MELQAKLTPTEIYKGSFEDDKGETVEYVTVQFLTTVSKRVGDEYRDFEDVATMSCRKELADLLEVDKEALVAVTAKAQQPKKGGFPIVKYTIVNVIK